MAGRASGQARDLRCDFPVAPYDSLARAQGGARTTATSRRASPCASTRSLESLRLIQNIAKAVARRRDSCAGAARSPEFRLGLGYVEGWRGPVLVALTSGPDGTIRRCHPHDPSWSNWPVLEHAVIGNIVPDFPLINKSFNLTYSGHDL